MLRVDSTNQVLRSDDIMSRRKNGKVRRVTYSIGIHCEDVLVECRVNTDDIAHLMVNLELKRRHRSVEVHPVQVLHDENLTITLSTITRFRALGGLSDLDNNDVANFGVRFKLNRGREK